MSLLEMTDVSVGFATEDGLVRAVKGMSLSLAHAEILALCGESGCGKTVTAMSIPRLLPAETTRLSGSITLDGRDLTALSEAEMRDVRGKDVSVVFQEPMTSLNPSFTVGFQIGEVLRRHEDLSRAAARARAVDLLKLVGIPDPASRIKEYPHQLSGGMRQRVMIAIAVACSPRVLIADEPTTALDVTIQAGVLNIFRDLRDRLGTAIILITHDLGVVADIADRAIVMYAGRAVEAAPVEELYARPRHPYTVGLLNALPTAATAAGRRRLAEIPGMVPPPFTDPDACAFAPRCPRAEADCTAARPPLESHGASHLAACLHPVAAVRTGATP
ncbi:MAG TPA: ABC transporter ATP-binding protein [Streptosporangiaceae bacterium]|jgi:oligopeptide/dipeptide ABC transporter ATP-binding protein|nr:ABC transporter ATP-binding protein [Streptosporangiaceae bacterium]